MIAVEKTPFLSITALGKSGTLMRSLIRVQQAGQVNHVSFVGEAAGTAMPFSPEGTYDKKTALLHDHKQFLEVPLIQYTMNRIQHQ
jgi:hypothetical protein